VARTYAYVADGREGLAIIDVQNPEAPRLTMKFDADGRLNDARAVQIGSVAASMYALVADGHNGFRVLQMISPDTVDGSYGFSPTPAPRLIATYPTKHAALAIGRGLDRDRVVDETGNQTVVFGRRGARPFHVDEMRQFYMHDAGDLYRVDDTVLRRVEEKITLPNGSVITQKVTKLFTKGGKELKIELPPPPPWYNAAPNQEFKVPEKFNLNDTFLPEGTKAPAVEEIPRPKEAPKPGEPAKPESAPPPQPAGTPPPIIEAPKPAPPLEPPKKTPE